jgi:hypothetical protein
MAVNFRLQIKKMNLQMIKTKLIFWHLSLFVKIRNQMRSNLVRIQIFKKMAIPRSSWSNNYVINKPGVLFVLKIGLSPQHLEQTLKSKLKLKRNKKCLNQIIPNQPFLNCTTIKRFQPQKMKMNKILLNQW